MGQKNGDEMVPPPRRAAILGCGRMARVVARILGGGGAEVRIYGRNGVAAKELASELGGVIAAATMKEAIDGAEVVFFAVPATAIAEVAERYGDLALPDHVVLHASRGVGEGFSLPHRMIRARTCVRKIGVLGGPLHAIEVGSGRPLAAVLASRFSETIQAVQVMTRGMPVIIHGSRDVIGVEVAGALSNVAAIAAGMSEALDLGDTARGVLLTHGLLEAKRLGVALGADPATFAGLAGVGDLIPRKVSSTDRHRLLGSRIAGGASLATALAELGKDIEGVLTAAEATKLAARLGLQIPLAAGVDEVLAGRGKAREMLEGVLRQDLDLDLDPKLMARAERAGAREG